MFRCKQLAAVAVVVALATVTMSAQKMTQTAVGSGGSQHVKTEWTIDGAHITVEYGRPALKGRAEDTLMPVGKAWRTGADAATIITSDKALKFGAFTLPAGTHTINTVPGASDWQLMFGKLSKPGQWGIPYVADLEIGKVSMTLGKTSAPVEQVTISIDDTPAGATLRIEWGTKSATAPFTVG